MMLLSAAELQEHIHFRGQEMSQVAAMTQQVEI